MALFSGAALLAALAAAAALPAHATESFGASGSIRFVGRIVDSGFGIESWIAMPGGSPRQQADGATRFAFSPAAGGGASSVRAQGPDGNVLALRRRFVRRS